MSTTSLSIRPQIEEIRDYSPFHQRITIGPFERGYGHTLGNALRRVLLSGVPGFAPTEVKIEGVEHQYSTITGVSEDVIEILLNLKGVAFRVEGGDRADVSIDKKGPGAVTAADIKLPGQVTVINPDHHIATLSSGSALKMKVVVEGGRGYRPASTLSAQGDKAFGTILLDASFSPVRNVAVEVEGARVESRTDLDRVVIDLKTNGIHNPEDMIRFAGRLLVDQLSVFADFDRESSGIDQIGTRVQEEASSRFYETIDVLGLSVRLANNLKQENIYFIGDLVVKSEKELLKTPRLGKKSVDEVKIALAEMDLTLDMNIGRFDADRSAL